MNKITGVSKHAIDRYMERSKCRDRERARAAITEIATHGTPVGDWRYECKGWMAVVNAQGWVETIFRKTRMENAATLKKRKFDYA